MPVQSKHIDLSTFTTWLDQLQQQPAWRARADREADYYDGNQLDAEVLQRQRELGIPPAIEPLIKPTIDAVLGLEVKQRTDWKVVPDDDETGDEVAEALNHKLNQAERHAKADASCSEAFRGQIGVGLGWVEVSRDSDPFKYPYRCRAIHRNEIFWDFLSKEPDLSDARYLVRRKWTDLELALLMFPKHKDLLSSVGSGWKGLDFDTLTPDGGTSTDLAMSWDMERGWSVEEQEWRDLEAGRVCLFEVWYRQWVRVKVIKTPDGRVVEFDRKDERHQIAVSLGAEIIDAVVGKVRLAWFCGPHLLSDEPTPYRHHHFPYVPFFGFREDRTGVPYGMIRGMIFLQDEVNARISKMQWLLSARSTIRTDGIVVQDDEEFRQMVGRPDADIILDPAVSSQPGARFDIERNFELNRQQFDRLQDAREGIKRVSGVTASFEGNTQSSATSGIAVNSLIEQSVQAITDILDNFKAARMQVGDLLLSLIVQDSKPNERVNLPKTVTRDEHQIALNVPVTDENTGIELLNNDVQRTKLKVTLEDVPSTPSFRAQQLAAMSEAFKSMPQRYQEATMPFLFALMDVPNKQEVLEVIRNLANVPSEEEIEQRIKDAVVKAGLEIKGREVAIKEGLSAAQIQHIVSQSVAKTIESIYSATQAGMQIASVPGIAPIADQLLRSAGFQDRDAPPIVAPGPIVPGTMASPQVEQNTSPMFPPRANPEQVQPPTAEEVGMEAPAVGMNKGIEEGGLQ